MTTRPVSRSVLVEATCPFCGTSAPTEMWMVVDVDKRPDLAQALSEHRLNTYTCAVCGDGGALDGPLLVAGGELRLILLYSPPDPTRRLGLQGGPGWLVGRAHRSNRAPHRGRCAPGVLPGAATRDLVVDADDLAEGHLDIDDAAYQDFLCTVGRPSDPRMKALRRFLDAG